MATTLGCNSLKNFRGEFDFRVRRQPFVLFGGKFRILNYEGRPVGFCRKPGRRLWDEFRVYSNATESEELLRIKERRTKQAAWYFDVVEASTGDRIGTVERRPRFFDMGKMILFDSDDEVVGEVPSLFHRGIPLARFFVSRSIRLLVPVTYRLHDAAGQSVGSITTGWNPFVSEVRVALKIDSSIHPWLALATAIVILDNEE